MKSLQYVAGCLLLVLMLVIILVIYFKPESVWAWDVSVRWLGPTLFPFVILVLVTVTAYIVTIWRYINSAPFSDFSMLLLNIVEQYAEKVGLIGTLYGLLLIMINWKAGQDVNSFMRPAGLAFVTTMAGAVLSIVAGITLMIMDWKEHKYGGLEE